MVDILAPIAEAPPERVPKIDVMGYLERQSKMAVVGFSLLMVVLAGLLQYLVGRFVIYYLVPVGLVAWFVGLWPGLLMALVSATASGAAWGLESGRGPAPSLGISGATVTLQLLVFLGVFAYVLTRLRAALAHAEQLARTDYLTGVANARDFFELARAELGRAQRYMRPLTLAYLDIDDFKSVNDRLGHAAGDAVLRAMAETIRARIRKSDVVARLGGDEFALLLPEAGYEAGAAAVGKIEGSLAEVMQARGWRVTFSIGVVTYLAPPDVTLDELLKVADGLMYSAKQGGKNHIRHEMLGKGAGPQRELFG